MRRLAVLALSTVLLAAPAGPGAAAEPGAADHAAQVLDLVFPAHGTAGQNDIYGYAAQVLAGLDGEWLPVTKVFLTDEIGADAADRIGGALRDFCSKPLVVTIARTGADGFAFRQGIKAADGSDQTIAIDFTAVGGSTFVQHADPVPYLAWLGIRSDLEAAKSASLLSRQGLFREVEVLRPYPDVLVLAPDRAVPEIYARCPAS